MRHFETLIPTIPLRACTRRGRAIVECVHNCLKVSHFIKTVQNVPKSTVQHEPKKGLKKRPIFGWI